MVRNIRRFKECKKLIKSICFIVGEEKEYEKEYIIIAVVCDFMLYPGVSVYAGEQSKICITL